LELALKAFLSVKGRSLAELAGGKFSHDLVNLLAEADKEGLTTLVTLKADQLDQLRKASSYYKGKVFEYPALFEAVRGFPEMPDIDLLFSAVKALVEVLREPCLNA